MKARLFRVLLFALAAAASAAQAQTHDPGAQRLAALLESVRPDSRVEMFYLGTPDCPYCAQWESRAKGELLASSAGKSLRFVEIRGETLRLPITAKHYPPEYRWVYDQVGPSRGVPRFLLALDGKVVLNALGTGGYNNVFLPVLKEVAARRGGGAL